jgi:hypothetical protein
VVNKGGGRIYCFERKRRERGLEEWKGNRKLERERKKERDI